MANIFVVDENDNFIRFKDRVDRNINDIYRVSALWIVNSKDEILIAQRKLNKIFDPGKWGPAVSGTVEEGETYLTNMIKEAEEEIGLTNFDYSAGEKRFVNVNDNKRICQFYKAVVNKDINEFVIQEDEVEAVRWISKAELLSELKNNPDNFTAGLKFGLEIF